MKHLLHIFLFLILFSGCRIQGAISPVSRSDSTYVSKADSVYIRDSIYIDRWHTAVTKGDTVYVTDTRTEYKYRYRDREVHDTLFVDRDVIVEKTVPAELSSWDKFQKKAFWIMASIIIFYIIIKLILKKL